VCSAWNTLRGPGLQDRQPRLRPVNAIPPSAVAYCQLRFVVGTDPHDIIPALRRHLDRHGFGMIEIEQARDVIMNATRLDPENPWAKFASSSIEKTAGQKPNMLPNLGGSLPNEVFTDILGLPTVWGAALLCRLLAACAGRASTGTGRPGRAAPDDRAVLGFGRAGPAGVSFTRCCQPTRPPT
jgi:hypothetical protein